MPFSRDLRFSIINNNIYLLMIESQTLQFLGLKEQNEYIVENFFMSTQTEDGITYLKVKKNISKCSNTMV